MLNITIIQVKEVYATALRALKMFCAALLQETISHLPVPEKLALRRRFAQLPCTNIFPNHLDVYDLSMEAFW